jgi:hypothetical protein
MMSCDKNDAENTMDMQDAVKITTKGLFREEFDMLLSQKVQFSCLRIVTKGSCLQ